MKLDEPEIQAGIARLARRYQNYRSEAFHFICRAVAFVNREVMEKHTRAHINSCQLTRGAQQLAINEYGPLALDVLQHWGIKSSRDIGNLVFALTEEKILITSEQDKPDDFPADEDEFRQALMRHLKADETLEIDKDDPPVII